MELAELIQRYQTLHGVQGNIARYTVDPSGRELLRNIKRRIFTEGKNSGGAQIGQYSTNPIYATRKQFASPGSFMPQGESTYFQKVNRGGKQFRRRAKVKTMYLPQGYKQLREIQGKETQFVNLNYRGKTMRAYVIEPTETGAIIGLNTTLAAQIRFEQERRFRANIFNATQTEISDYNKAVDLRLTRILRGIIVDGQQLESVVETATEGVF